MIAPAPSGGSSPLRVGGMALLGIGIVAGIIGLISVALGGGDDRGQIAAPGPSASVTADPAPSADATPPDSAAPTGDGSVPLPSFGATPSTDISAPPGAPDPGAGAGSGSAGSGSAGSGSAGGSAAGSGGGSGTAAVRSPLRVYNNSTIRGLAARAAADFRAAGWTVTEIEGYPYGIIPTSTVYYRPGTSEQAAADELARSFDLRSEPRFEGLRDATPGLIVIVTRDYASN